LPLLSLTGGHARRKIKASELAGLSCIYRRLWPPQTHHFILLKNYILFKFKFIKII
jgi:hypothetical protein